MTSTETTVRRGTQADHESASEVWRAAVAARRGGTPPPPEHGSRIRGHLETETSFLFVAESGGEVVGMAAAMQGLADDGAGPPVAGLCHIGAVFVSPRRWGEGVGGLLVDAALSEARTRGYDRVSLWTHDGNARSRRLYERRGFERSGREKEDDLGEWIVHYEREL